MKKKHNLFLLFLNFEIKPQVDSFKTLSKAHFEMADVKSKNYCKSNDISMKIIRGISAGLKLRRLHDHKNRFNGQSFQK